MSITYSIHDPLIVVVVREISTYEEISKAIDAMIKDPAFTPPAKIILDARCTDYAPPSEELEMLAGQLGKMEAFQGSRWAIVAQPISHIFGMARVFCTYAEFSGLNAEPFSDFGKACEWLMGDEAPSSF